MFDAWHGINNRLQLFNFISAILERNLKRIRIGEQHRLIFVELEIGDEVAMAYVLLERLLQLLDMRCGVVRISRVLGRAGEIDG